MSSSIRIGPWIQPMSENSYRVMWEGEQGRVEYELHGEPPSSSESESLDVEPANDSDTPSRIQHARVPAPKPGNPVSYRVVVNHHHSTTYNVMSWETARRRMLHLSNPNSWAGKPSSLLRWVTSNPDVFDIVIISGDITTNGSNQSFARFFNGLGDIAATKPMILAPGNHDIPVRGRERRNYAAWVHGVEPVYEVVGNLSQRFFSVHSGGVDWVCIDDSIHSRMLQGSSVLRDGKFTILAPTSDVRALVCNGNFKSRNRSLTGAVEDVGRQSDLVFTAGHSRTEQDGAIWIMSGAGEHHAHLISVEDRHVTAQLMTRAGKRQGGPETFRLRKSLASREEPEAEEHEDKETEQEETDIKAIRGKRVQIDGVDPARYTLTVSDGAMVLTFSDEVRVSVEP